MVKKYSKLQEILLALAGDLYDHHLISKDEALEYLKSIEELGGDKR